MIRTWLRVHATSCLASAALAKIIKAPIEIAERVIGDGHNVRIGLVDLSVLIQCYGTRLHLAEPKGDPSSDFVVELRH